MRSFVHFLDFIISEIDKTEQFANQGLVLRILVAQIVSMHVGSFHRKEGVSTVLNLDREEFEVLKSRRFPSFGVLQEEVNEERKRV